MKVAGLFAGIGGFELGLSRSGFSPAILCENWEPATATLRRRFHGADVVGDIRELGALPDVDVVTAGFPCTDLSQAGRTAGITGVETGLVNEAFRLIEKARPRWVVLENVPNLLNLHAGAPIRHITSWFDDRGWNWAYRTVDSQHFGVRQRRRRVFLVASKTEDPRTVLFADEAPHRKVMRTQDAFGFSWTEGNRGLGWGEGVTPTLKGGSKLAIASPPGIWMTRESPGNAIVRPHVRAGERLQGFRAGWTDNVNREGERWKLLGNAVTVPVAAWIGRRLVNPGNPADVERGPHADGTRWPTAAAAVGGAREVWRLSERPLVIEQSKSLSSVLAAYGAHPLSAGATNGFAGRLEKSNLRYRPAFLEALIEHGRFMSAI